MIISSIFFSNQLVTVFLRDILRLPTSLSSMSVFHLYYIIPTSRKGYEKEISWLVSSVTELKINSHVLL